MRDPLYPRGGRTSSAGSGQTFRSVWVILGGGLVVGYILGMVLMETADVMFTTGAEHHTGHSITADTSPITHLGAAGAAGGEGAGQRLDTEAPVRTLSQSEIAKSDDSSSSKGGGKAGSSGGVTSSGGAQESDAQQLQRQVMFDAKNKEAKDKETKQKEAKEKEEKDRPAGDTIHSLLTSNGSPYQNFQGRIMYGTYKLIQKMQGGEKHTGFTRILHRTKDDEVMAEIPTFRAKPLHPECDIYCDFPVADRPNAVQQWIDAVDKDPSMLKGAWVFLIEGDYVWMKPLPAPDAYSDAPGLQFHFDYIIPTWTGVTETLTRLMRANYLDTMGGAIPPSGPAPALLRFWELKKMTPAWEVMTAAIEHDQEAVKLLGWVREMYAWDVAVVAKGIRMLTQEPLVSPLLVQPPHDLEFGNASICHYTWGAIYNDTKGEIYKWEKREYTRPEYALKVPHIPMPPQPWKEGWHLQDNLPVGKKLHETLTAMLAQMNKAIDTLPDLTSSKAA